MNKFFIEKAIIEKSDKDINIGTIHKFNPGLNIICGENEAGKSTLMEFIKKSLFLKNNGDVGSVFINIQGKDYVIQINKSNSKNIIYSLSENTKIDANFIKQNVPQKEINHVFSINLDDLMGIKDENTKTLINLMKDSSCGYLNKYIEDTEESLSKVWGKTTVVKELAKLKNEINNLNKEIKEQSHKEKKYNEIIFDINKLNDELNQLNIEKENINNREKISKINEKIKDYQNEYNSLITNFNSYLNNKNAEYIQITEDYFTYKNNLEIINANEKKVEELNSKILFVINKLKKEFCIEIKEKELNDFNIDSQKIKKISTSIEEINSLNNKLNLLFSEENSIQENIKNIEEKINILNYKYKFSDSIEELEDIYKYIDTNLKYYNHLQNEIEERKNKNIINYISSDRIFVASYSFIIILMLSLTALSFYNKMHIITSLSIFILVLFIGIFVLIYQNNNSNKSKENQHTKEKILNELIAKIKDICPDFEEVNQSLVLLKINDIKQEIYNKKEQLSEKIKEKKDSTEKLEKINVQIIEIQKREREIRNENQKIINSDFFIQLSENEYLKIIEIIDSIKDVINEKLNLINKNKNYLEINNNIQNKFKSFIIENKINIHFDDEYQNKIEQLKFYYRENSQIGNEIESIKLKLDNLIEEKIDLEKKLNLLNENKIFSSLVELEFECSQKNKQKEDLLGQKSSLEQSESTDTLKMQRNILQDKYNSAISFILKNKIILLLCEKAKMNFDKKQPNIQKAQEFLSIMTNGKYTKINIENELIQNKDGTKIKEWNTLSRGTKELLYFSLKLGFAYNYSKDKITQEQNEKWNLPLIIDDAFVNFDSIRMKNAIKCLVEFSKTNQVLFFTCHSDTLKKYFDELGKDFNVVNL